MRKIGNEFYTAVALLRGTPLRCRTALRGAALCAALCAALLSGCVRDDDVPFGERHEVAVQLNVRTRAVGETDGTPTEAERKIHTLRIYAFVGGRPAGHYYTDDVTADPHTFFMDLVFYSAGEQTVDFYAVANEQAMSASVSLSENTTERQLEDLYFTNYLRSDLETKGLPMYCDKTSVALDFTKVKTETPTASGHEGHAWLDCTDIEFELRRSVAKIGVFAAKPAGETGSLRVTGLTMLAQGTQRRNYLMPQSTERLQEVLSGEMDVPIAVIDGEVGAQLAETADRSDPANYTPVMNEPFYPFENPWSNGGDWSVPGSSRQEHVLRIDYAFDGEDPRTGYVYLPAVERNKYYAICCVMHHDGRLAVEYSVADWTDAGEYTIEFNYPQYTNPLQPASGAAPGEGRQYPQPTVWYNSDATSDDGSYTFQFNIAGPVGQKWNPVLGGELGTPDNFEVKVYQMENGTKRYITLPEDMIASPGNPYYITVKALKGDNIDRTVSLGIAYDRSWSTDGSALLLINGLTHDLSWAGTEVAEYVVIKQVDVPASQNN